MLTVCHLGARNSFTERPTSPYVKGETQKPHFNQGGIEAASNKKAYIILLNNCPKLEFDVIETLLSGIIKPANKKRNSCAKLVLVIAATMVRETDPKKRNRDVAAKCTEKSSINCPKNLRYQGNGIN